MRPAGCPPLLALLLLALALSPHGTQGRPRGRRGAGVAAGEPKPSLFLPARGVGRAPAPLVHAAASPALGVPRSSEISLRDLNLKDKFIKHFTGPVTFSAECSKHFHRLYHNTRDCSTPTYYKRCARLLTRLAASPLCTQT
ncbi:ALK and LTK ligand 1 [Choloepus didactylus]|uniref:ALK and LTK ligand 1 n=1 Tax=Choloepus didactylus TaxID=27675 RepID=UPI00189F6A44|nr:ALK and LTK ligand 1 [Choloepus didactylus]